MYQPVSVGKIRFPPRDVLDMPGVAHQNLGEVPVLDQRVVDGHAVDPGGLHRHVGHAERGQPPGGLPQHPVERLERPPDRLPALRPVPGQPDRNRDHVLADINRGAPLIQHLHTCLLPAQKADRSAHAARRVPE